VTHDDVQAWLDTYVEAWHTYDPAAVAALFTEDTTYAYHPWGEDERLVRGRDAIDSNGANVAAVVAKHNSDRDAAP
jgi:uncharacterized protein (TIGR02246 family)